MISKQKTIWKYGILFADKDSDFDDMGNTPMGIMYQGKLSKLPSLVAEQVAEIHPNYSKYNEYAMATLYKTYSFKTGTESPTLAIKTLRKKSEEKMDYVLIWKIIE